MIEHPIRAISLLLLAFPLGALGADAIQGKILYQSTCVRCHRTDQGRLQTPPSQVPEVLRSGRISPHRFTLSETDLDNLVEYLESLEPRP